MGGCYGGLLWGVAMGGCYGWMLIGACNPTLCVDVPRPGLHGLPVPRPTEQLGQPSGEPADVTPAVFLTWA